MSDNDLELIPIDVRNNKSIVSYTKFAINNLMLYSFERDESTKEWTRVPQSVVDESNKNRQLIKPLETAEERKERLEKSRLRREAKKKAEEDFEDFLDFEDFDNEIEIEKAEELLRLLRAQELECLYKEESDE